MLSRYCTILELTEEQPNSKAIERAYKKLAMRHHPDRGGDPEKFKLISEAYQEAKKIMGENEGGAKSLDATINEYVMKIKDETDILKELQISYLNDQAKMETLRNNINDLRKESRQLDEKMFLLQGKREQLGRNIQLCLDKRRNIQIDFFKLKYTELKRKSFMDRFIKNFLEKNIGVSPNQLLEKIQQRINANPNSTVAKSWKLVTLDAAYLCADAEIEKEIISHTDAKTQIKKDEIKAKELKKNIEEKIIDIEKTLYSLPQLLVVINNKEAEIKKLKFQYEEKLSVKINTFKKIYAALREGQWAPSLFKTNFLAGKEQLSSTALLEQIKEHIKKSPKSRVEKAYQLTNEHGHLSLTQNLILFKEIYNWSASQIKIFGNYTFNHTVTELNEDQINKEKNNNSRIGCIYRTLR